MHAIKHLAYLMVIFATFYFGFLPPVLAASKTCDPWVAKAVSIQGVVEARKAGQTRWVQVNLNDTFCNGDMIRVQENSRAAVVLSNETNLSLDQKTTITFTGIEQEKYFLLDLLSGALHFFSRFPRSIKVLTPFLNASVEGTEGFISVKEDEVFLSIFEGKVLASNSAGRLMLSSGQSAAAGAAKAPALRVVARPRDAVHWALYYLPVIYVPPAEAPKEDLRDPRFLAYRASRFLAVGRVDKADIDIQRALRLDPKYSDAFALQTIIAVVQNEKDKALNAAQRAVDTGPTSATARIALSYARQASFDLESARASVEEAVKLDPNNALAWARLAELWSSFGRLGKALDAAKKAVDLDPNLSRTQMILGFAYLTQVKTTESRAAFEKAIELDQADPLSRLGLGLAKIRDGDLQKGGREIEIAASLDPNNSLIRSYLGKTYFEEKRTNLDGREYAIAKELDPNDPTPYFYDAIAKQTTNRPVEALHNLQKAKELNDNRAVYRSKLLLDSDEAARSASIARIYNDLNFQQRALFEGWMSVNTDPTSFSAHRFLADSYAALPRRQIARVSELLQSQLLQPLNITPIQPLLAESNLFLISAGGSENLSFNEFNPIFNRNRFTVQASGLAGENDTYGGEGIASGIYKKFSFSGGYTHAETDGWRNNADQNEDVANLFAQLELTYKTSIQAEYRYRDSDRGDVQLRFFEDDFLPNLDEEDNTKTLRLGFRHAFTPGSTLIGNLSYQDADRDLSDRYSYISQLGPPPIEGFFGIDGDEDAVSWELQHLFRSPHFNTVAGAGLFNIDFYRVFTQEEFDPFFDPPELVFSSKEKENTDIDHFNLYLYSNINVLNNLTLTVGASGDLFNREEKERDDRDYDRNKFNPKFGITWNPWPVTTLRGAVFRTFKRTLITDQTLEPTQVAGFNQFFDDFNGTEAWLYGAAVDQKFSQSLYAGGEFYYRDLDVPYFDNTAPPGAPSDFKLGEADWEEYLGRAYLYWTPHEWLALRAEYQYEKFDRDEDFTFGIKDLKTHRFPLGINFFHPSGLSAGLQATYYDQDGDFETIEAEAGDFTSGDDQFWLVDASINYRLPKRYGILRVGVRNLFDEEFEFADTDRDNPHIQPDRFFFATVTLAFP